MTRTFDIGQDIKLEHTYGPPPWPDAFAALEATRAAGLDGVNIRTLYEVSPTLDAGLLKDVRACADDLGLYLEFGIGKVNPYMTAELPHLRALGRGDYRAAMEAMIAAAASIGVTELWTATGGFKPAYRGLYGTDRFRGEAPWPDQLAATRRFLDLLAPCLRDHGSHLNLETHEEITTFELVRLVEDVGPDVLGICLDPANVPVRGEDPAAAVRRVAPYTRQTQLRDAALFFLDPEPEEPGAHASGTRRSRNTWGISRFLAPCGEGVIDWADLLVTLADDAPHLSRLTIEGIGAVRAEMTLHPGDPQWRAGHPDLTTAELAELFRLSRDCELRAEHGLIPGPAQLRGVHDDWTAEDFTARCAAHLRSVIADLPTPQAELPSRGEEPT
ncbi:sugar phosphate isomerase/epimerase family protein [Uniformispora flossi]|uniref:sugar phosphate isomerase/epimerase family protein n=1 Tax=Uniformispora flossi TaxID=3390723 RepID=UPI003C2E843B